jgi:hypothetical protein
VAWPTRQQQTARFAYPSAGISLTRQRESQDSAQQQTRTAAGGNATWRRRCECAGGREQVQGDPDERPTLAEQLIEVFGKPVSSASTALLVTTSTQSWTRSGGPMGARGYTSATALFGLARGQRKLRMNLRYDLRPKQATR